MEFREERLRLPVLGLGGCHLSAGWKDAPLPQSSAERMNVGELSNPEPDTFKHHDHYLGAARGPPT